MASADDAGPRAARCALQKSFQALREQHEAWERALAACTPLLGSLANLAEQMEASRKVALASPGPLRGFPCLPERLRRKQRCAAEALLEDLQGRLADLQKVRDALGLRVANVFLLCERPGEGGLRLESCFQRSALCPSVADMLEWLLDIEAGYHRTYLEVKLLLLRVSYENLAEMRAVPQAWEQVLQHSLQSVVEDTLRKVSFFLEDA